MKKLKFLPSVLMLVLCLAVLAVGIYAIKPTQNTIEGTITIGATNPHVVITAYKTAAVNADGTEATANKLVGPLDARAGAKLQIAEALEFDVDEANTLADVDDVVIVLKIENKSNKELGAYFYEGLSTDVMPEEATIDNVRTSYLFKQNAEDADEDAVINTSFTGYSYIAPYVSDEDDSNITYMQITFSLNQFKEYTSNFNFPLNIESYNEDLDYSGSGLMLNVVEESVPQELSISTDLANPTTFAGDKSYDAGNGSFSGITNLVYTPATTQAVQLASAGEEPTNKFSFDIVYNSPEMITAFEGYGIADVTLEEFIFGLGGAKIYTGNYSSYQELNASGNALNANTDFMVTKNTITIYENEKTANVTEFCLMYVNPGDLQLCLATPSFKEGEGLEATVYVTQVKSADSIICANEEVAQEYTLADSTDEAIQNKVSITKSKLKDIPKSVKAVNIYANVKLGSMYLMQADKYNTLSSTKSLSEIISQIQLGNDLTNQNIFVSAGQETEEENVTLFEIPTFWCEEENLNLVTILLSETQQQTQKVKYSIEYSNKVESEVLIYTLVEDATNGNYYNVAGAVSRKVEEFAVPATYNQKPVKQIVKQAFSGHLIKSVDLSNATNLTTIGEHSFDSCSALTTVNLTGANNLTTIGRSAFYICSSLINVTIPESVTEIGDYAFYWCSKITSINLPANVASIGQAAFGLNDLETITVAEGNTVYSSPEGSNAIIKGTELVAGCKNTQIPDTVSVIGSYAFYGCRNLSNITIPEGVTSIGGEAFYGCENLPNITIPEGVTSIGFWAFYGCKKLTKIHIPASLTSIYTATGTPFEDCSALESITVAEGNTVYSSPEGSNAILKGTTLVLGCKNTKIPDSVTIIGKDAFSGCTGLTSIVIPEGVTTISYGAFSYCTGLTSITIPASVSKIGQYAFNVCNNITYTENGIKYVKSGTNNYFAVIGYTSDLPANITINENCKIIADKAFSSCTSITSLTIPASVISIGNDAFYNCTSLADVNIESAETSSLIIWASAFSKCTSLTSFTIPASVTSISHSLFANCSKLATITVKEGAETTFDCTLPYAYTLTNAVAGTSSSCTTSTYIKRAASGDNVYTKK